MTDEKNGIQVRDNTPIDPIDFVTGVMKGGVKGTIDTSNLVLHAVRERKLKETLIQRIATYAEEGRVHESIRTEFDIIDTCGDIEDIFEAIDAGGMDSRKYHAVESVFLHGLTKSQKEQVLSRTLLRIVLQLSTEEIVVLQALSDPGISDLSAQLEKKVWQSKIAEHTGLIVFDFVRKAFASLEKRDLIYTDHRSGGTRYPFSNIGKALIESMNSQTITN